MALVWPEVTVSQQRVVPWLAVSQSNSDPAINPTITKANALPLAFVQLHFLHHTSALTFPIKMI